MKKSFTLLELLIVIIIIGVLTVVALPQYFKGLERAKAGKAKRHLKLLAQAEKLYHADNSTYLDFTKGEIVAKFSDWIELSQVQRDPDWDYFAAGSTADSFTVTAQRLSGPNAGETITINQNGVWGGTFSP